MMYINSLRCPIRNVLHPFRPGAMLCVFLVHCKLSSSPISHRCFTYEPWALYFSYSPPFHILSYPAHLLYHREELFAIPEPSKWSGLRLVDAGSSLGRV